MTQAFSPEKFITNLPDGEIEMERAENILTVRERKLFTDPGGNKALYNSRTATFYLDCEYCMKEFHHGSFFFPSHEASKGCESGGYAHCSCDGCF